MRHKYSLLGVGLVLASVAPGCGTIIGLDDYEVVDAPSGSSGGKGNGSGGKDNTGGDMSSAGTSSTGGSNTGGSGGKPVTCDTGCDDDNECTTDSCVGGECVNEPVKQGEECDAGYCNAAGECVACLDNKVGFAVDLGCSSITPSCELDAEGVPYCKGCMTGADCDDGNDCTIDNCDAHYCIAPTNRPAGTACDTDTDNSHVCDDSGKCSDCWDTSTAGVDAGCQLGAGSCDISGEEPVCTGCTNASDCDDGNDCTQESCGAGGKCVLTALPAGNACTNGVCNGVEGGAACLPCLDDDSGVATSDVDSGCESVVGKPFCDATGSVPQCVACLDTQAGNVPGQVDSGCSAATPFCLDSASGPVCKKCVDDETGNAQDSGCSAATPMCDTTGGGAVCRECMTNGDCNDGVSCTNDTCVSNACVETPSDALCSSSGDVCMPNKCNVTLGCQQVDISVSTVLMDENTGNGSVETKTFTPTQIDAAGWTEAGPYWLVYNCSVGCIGSTTNDTFPLTGNGNNVIWLGHQDAVGGDLNAQITIPANAVKLRMVADINFQTQSTSASNADKLNIWFENTNGTHIGTALKAYQANSPASPEVQTGSSNTWTPDGLSVEWSVVGFTGNRRISFESTSVDAPGSDKTSWFLDNVRITATVCAP